MVEIRRHIMKAVIDRFEGKCAVVTTEDKQKILWPIKSLPDDAQEGTKVRLIISTPRFEQEEKERVAKTVLNEILKDK